MANKERKLKLEDLMKVKAAERPDAQFWERFDLELNERALKTCIKRESLLERMGAHLVEHVLPITATVAVVMFFGAISLIQTFQVDSKQSTVGLSVVDGHLGDAIASNHANEEASLVANDESVFEDYAVEIITVSNELESVDFAADSIPVAIGSTANYSELVADANTLKYTKAYTQLASYAF